MIPGSEASGSGGGAPPPAKRQRREALPDALIFAPKAGLPAAVLTAWKKSLPALGATLTEVPTHPGITHCVVPFPGRGWAAVPPELQPGAPGALPGLRFVTQHWVVDCLKSRAPPVPEEDYAPPAKGSPEAAQLAPPPPAPPPPAEPLEDGGAGVAARRRWLGPLWRPECEQQGLVELVLQGDYDEERCRRIGNEQVVQALHELNRLEVALNGPTLPADDGSGRKVGNHKALAYAQAAGVVRTCAYRLRAPVKPGQLPWCAESICLDINQILETGSCDKLEAFRADRPVRDSKGRLRADSAGAATRRRFAKLPGVGARKAQEWWELGLRTYADVLEAAAGRWPSTGASGASSSGGGARPGGGKPLALAPLVRFSLEHHEDLLAGPTDAELAEMRQVVTAGLEAASGTAGWQISLVGGSRRQQRPEGEAQPVGRPHHDADFVVSHPSYRGTSLLGRLAALLLDQRRIKAPESGATFALQERRMEDVRPQVLAEIQGHHEGGRLVKGGLESDRLDHLFCVFISRAGRLRRLDVILASPASLPYAEVSWIGSTMINRWMRRLCDQRGMHLCSYGLYRLVGGQVRKVPEEAPPLDRHGRPWWPPGWGPHDAPAHAAAADALAADQAAAPAAAAPAPAGAAGAPQLPPADGQPAAAVVPADGDGGSWRSVRSMRDIWELLGLPWREPHQRDCP